jgi:hypothetical protein
MKRLLRSALALALFALNLAAVGPARAEGVPGELVRKVSRFEDEYRLLASDRWKSSFPNLGSDYRVVGRRTPKKGARAYNCIAHTCRINDRWVWPGDRLRDFDRLYSRHGYRRVRGGNLKLSKKYEKIVIYGKRKDGRLKITHGALQLHNGRWSSKLGQGPLIVHVKANAVSGPSYGKPIAVYYREREQE